MSDHDIVEKIGELVDESHRLRALGPDETDEGVRARLRSVEVLLDQCWDLLRNRRALEDRGEDPEQAHVRPAEVVESYEQ